VNAVVLRETGAPEVLRVDTVPDPEPGPGEVVVALRAAALNRRDVFLRKGIAPSPLPVIPGSDGAGVVRSLGAGVSGVAEGDEVVILPSLGWGGGEDAPAPGFRILGGPDDGTYAELIRIPAENVFPRPSRLSWDEAAALPLAGLTAYRALVSRARVRPGETVLIIGIGGGVATIALHIAREAGCRVLVTSSSDEKIARAVEMGADGGVNYRGEEWPAAVRELAAPRGVDVVVDSVGSTWADSVGCLRPGGRVVAFGGTGGGKVEMLVRPVTMGQVSLLGTTMGSPRDFAGLLAAVDAGSWAPVIDSVRPLAEAAGAHAREEAGEHFGKLVLSIGS
jgi:NADPH:quinone reductase-like Zn-dependent oxidoreductase